MELSGHRRDWEELAALDPMWAVVSNPEKRFGRWDADEFFATGEREVEMFLARGAELGFPRLHDEALDFGCGVGRVTRALATRYRAAVGIDISQTMIDQARDLNRDVANLEFTLNDAADLAFLEDERFDLVYTRHVLQHLPDRAVARAYLAELVRVLRPGGLLVFQIPVKIHWRHRGLLARRAYVALRKVGLSPRTLYHRLRLHPISMLHVPEVELQAWVEAAGGSIAEIDRREGLVVNANVFVTRRM